SKCHHSNISYLVLAERRRVHQTAIGPQIILSTSQTIRREIAFEHFTIVTHQLDRAIDKVIAQAKLGAKFAFHAKQTPYDRVFAGEEIIDVRRGNAMFLSLD